MKIRFFVALAMLFAVATAPCAHADSYPTHPIRMVIPFPAGGPTDVMTRLLSDRLGAALGQPVVVENKPGAGGTIGSEFVAQSAPDGYILLMATGSTHSVAPYVQKVPYDPQKDFTPVIYVGYATNILLISPKLPVNNVKELIAYAKQHPGEVNFSSSGIGSVAHVTAEMFASMAGIKLTHVPYKGTQLSVPDMMSGQISLLFDNTMTAKPHIDSGRLKGLAISSKQRSSLVPNLPTIDEAGLPGFDSYNWFGIFGPAHMPPAVVERLNTEMNKILNDPAVKAKFSQLGFEVTGGTPAAFAQVVKSEGRRWSKVIHDAHVKAD